MKILNKEQLMEKGIDPQDIAMYEMDDVKIMIGDVEIEVEGGEVEVKVPDEQPESDIEMDYIEPDNIAYPTEDEVVDVYNDIIDFEDPEVAYESVSKLLNIKKEEVKQIIETKYNILN